MNEITIQIERDDESGWLTASWDDPAGGGLTTQGRDLEELQGNIREAVRCHFDDGQTPQRVRLHFIQDPELALA